ncbi:uncharacterized protein LOC142767153 [Rhipicephalus microplus]|uniref:uncharacterized protein LOC142767153 n=1 Tax=Rhipicephalus microplus TaxID=6941 RepID=UPI003F6D459C
MAELSEMYQASLKPLPPNKPLPDETGFQNYFSPPLVGPNYFMPNYYFYPQAYPQPPPVYTLPPLPPAAIYAPASPEELEAFPANAPPNSVDSRRPGEFQSLSKAEGLALVVEQKRAPTWELQCTCK